MKSILITGCNRGLGLGLVKTLLKSDSPPKNLITTCRSVDKASELQQLASQHKNVHIIPLDVRNTESFDAFAKGVEEIVGSEGLNVLFNNAGYSPKSTRLGFVKADQLLETFAVNTVGPILLTKALLPTLRKAANLNKSGAFGSKKAAVINMTSILGSIALNSDGGLYPYRCSKAAINMATKSLSQDLKKDGILVACVHPGWVKTDMGGSNAPMSVEESSRGIVQLMAKLDESHTGGFFQWDGKELQW
uniref:Short-chain dehydrogenase n=1 Tax=Dendroctonus ponderosae TaxID=77166 RepID=J3JYF4_DENPD|nr:unknown [Dendroctonus ponderosae]